MGFSLKDLQTIEFVENECVRYELKEGGIIHGFYKKPIDNFDVTFLRTCKSVRGKLTKGVDCVFITDAYHVGHASRKTLSFLGTDEYLEDIKTAAVILHNPVQNFLANVFFKLLTSQKAKLKTFMNEEDALTWVKEVS